MCNNDKNKEIVLLHNHTHYSKLDGYATIDEYVKFAKENGHIGFGVADHGTASGLYDFITKMKKEDLIPVPGVEFYVAPENELGAKVKSPVYYGGKSKEAEKYDVSKGAYTHLTVYAYNNVGLSNLFRLTSMSYLKENFYTKPRIDTEMLLEHSEGLIVTTGCPSSEVSRRFLLGQDDKAYEYASRLHSVFGDNYYVEVMNHQMDDDELEEILVPKQIKLAKDLGIKIIATNDSHYLCKEDAIGHEHFLALATQKKMSEPTKRNGGKRFSFSGPEYYAKTYDEMKPLFPAEIVDEAFSNTLELTRKCSGISLDYRDDLRPMIPIPEGYTEETYLQKKIYEGFLKKRGWQSPEIQAESVKRIQEEFEVIHSNDFINYFLVVDDYIQYAHDNGIGVGAGRGSVGGSEIAYVLDISNTDPIRFDLLFERFLSPGRGAIYEIDYVTGESEQVSVSSKKQITFTDGSTQVKYTHQLKNGDVVNYEDTNKEIKNIFVLVPGSAPDVDTDFNTARRKEVIDYCVEKYGAEQVALIITFGTFKPKKAFKTICSLYSIPFSVTNKISDSIPSTTKTLGDLFTSGSPTFKEGADFRNAVEQEPKLKEIMKVAMSLEGRIAETGAHACGLIISSKTLYGKIPTLVRQEDNRMLTQWEYPEVESLGFIKMDMLGLELVDTIQNTIHNIELTNKTSDGEYVREVPDMRELIKGEMDDKESYELISRGDTVGIFQFGSPGVRELLKAAKPSSFMEIANITALYRPGPMSSGAHIQYSNRKSGEEEIKYIHQDFNGTAVEDVLKETYGLMIFQEQIMLIAGRYAGMTPYETEKLRKAVGKKKMEIMIKMKPKFIEGCLKAGASQEAVDALWDTIEVFGEYGFNKSHSVSYAINIYQAVYLKAHYPAEFMAAVIEQAIGTPEKLKSYIQEATRMKLTIGPVDINYSQTNMASSGVNPNRKYDIVYGISGVGKVNKEIAQHIVDERNENGLYKSVIDFVKRLNKRTKLQASVLSQLSLAGAFDSLGVSRKLVSEKAKVIISNCEKKETKGLSLFDLAGSSSMNVADSIVLEGEEFNYNEKISEEAKACGMFLSGHPISKLGHIASRFNAKTFEEIVNSDHRNGKVFNLFGTVTSYKSKLNKSGKKTSAIQLDDSESSITTWLPKHVIDGIDKEVELEKRKIGKGSNKPNERLEAILTDPEVIPHEDIVLNMPYLFKVKKKGYGDNASISIVDFQSLNTAPDGSLPYEVLISSRLESKKAALTKINRVVKKHASKNNDGSYVRIHSDGKFNTSKITVDLTIEFIMDMEKVVGKDGIITNDI